MNKLAEKTKMLYQQLEESIPVKILLIPLPTMNANSHGTANKKEENVTDKNQFLMKKVSYMETDFV